MSRRKGLLGLIAVLVVVLAVTTLSLGCSSSAPTTTSKPAPTTSATAPTTSASPKPTSSPSPSPTAAAQNKLTFTYSLPVSHPLTYMGTFQAARELERRTGGRVKVDVIGPAVIHSLTDAYNSIKSGITDYTLFAPSYTPGVFPLTSIMELPGIGTGCVDSTVGFWAAYQAGLLDNDYKGQFKVLGTISPPAYGFATVKKVVRNPEDLKGMKIRVSGSAQEMIAKALAASPVLIAWEDVYTAASKGMIDASITSYGTGLSMKHYEVFPYMFEFQGARTPNMIIANLAKFNSLPTDIQRTLEQIGVETMFGVATAYEDSDKMGRGVYAANKVDTHTPTADEAAAFRKVMLPIHETLLKSLEDKKITGVRDVYNYYTSYVDMVTTGNPLKKFQP